MGSLASNSVTSGSPSGIPRCNVTRAPPASRWARTARAEPDQPHRIPTSSRRAGVVALADDRLRGALRHVVAKRERIVADGFCVEASHLTNMPTRSHRKTNSFKKSCNPMFHESKRSIIFPPKSKFRLPPHR